MLVVHQFMEKQIKIGKQDILLSKNIASKARKLFEQNKLQEALEKYKIASNIDFTQYTYIEDMGIISFKLDQYPEALYYFDKVLKEFKPTDGKTEFYKGVILLDENSEKFDKKDACNLFKISLDKGFTASSDMLKKYCF